MTRIQDKLSQIIPSQLPEFIRSDYSTFVLFLKAYYQFLEQDLNAQEILQNALSYADIDRTVDSFIANFKKQFIDLIPESALADKKLLLKHAKDIYNRKGTSEAYKLFFKLLFNKESEVYFPGELVLRASDGRWERTTSIFIELIFGNPSDLVNQTVKISRPNSNFEIFISSFDYVTDYSLDTPQISNSFFEFFIDDSRNYDIRVGDVVEIPGFKGRVVPTIVGSVIKSAGTNYKPGQVFNIISEAGRDAQVKITKVSPAGGITAVQLLNFGIGYFNTFFYNLEDLGQESTTFTLLGNAITIVDISGNFIETGQIVRPTYSEDAFDGTYSGDLLGSFNLLPTREIENTSTVGLGVNSSGGIIQFLIGAKAKYPGYFRTVDGFLSDFRFLPDRDYYQPYSYVTKVAEQLDTYRLAILNLLHPAGTKLFGELDITNRVNLLPILLSTINYTTRFFNEEISFKEDILTFINNKSIDNFITQINSVPLYSFNKSLANVYGDYQDVLSYSANLAYFNNVETQESISVTAAFDREFIEEVAAISVASLSSTKNVENSFELIDNTFFALTSNQSSTFEFIDANLFFTFTSILEDGQNTLDVLSRDVVYERLLNDNQNLTESPVKSVINNQLDIFSTDDSLSVFQNTYNTEQFFAEDYVGEIVSTS